MAKPQIRLKGFREEWDSLPFLDIVDRVSTSGVSDSATPAVEFEDIISGEGLLNKDVTKKGIKKSGIAFSDGDILFGKLRPYLKNILLPNFNGIAVGDFWVLRPKQVVPYLLYNLVGSRHFMQVANISSGSKMPRADWRLVSGTEFSVPHSTSEQEGIAAYFRSLDELIQASAKKVDSLKQMKTACLQTMFPQPGETIPRVRFKGFTGDWETSKLSSLAKRVTRKNNNLETQLPLTISSQYGLVSQLDYFNNVVASANLSGYYLIKRGEFAYNKSYSTGYPFGSVKRLDSYDMGALSTLYIVFEVVSGVSSNYLACFFDTSLWYGEVSQRAAEGARNHGLLNISAEDFLDIKIMMPKSQTEQEQISSYFHELDAQIRLHEQKLEKLKQIKASCLDKMFV